MDPLGAAAIADIIRTLKDRGKTVLLSSHLLAQIEGMCDRVAILHRGRLIESGTMENLTAEEGLESLVVDRLPDAARAEVEAVLQRHGKSLRRTEVPRRSLDELFVRSVKEREAERIAAANDSSFGGGK